jgi:CheY-like chemotaxis protein
MMPVTILYVEDNDDLRATIGELLQQPDRNVTLRGSAEDALAVDRERRFDIVVTDISLPGMSGVELARELLRTDSKRRIVLCSGYELDGHALGFGPHVRSLTKPFEIEDLEALMDELCLSVRDTVLGGMSGVGAHR